jgi:transmembrane sensor
MNEERINHLVRVYAGNSATDEEVEELFEWLRLHPENEQIQTQLEKMAAIASPGEGYDPQYWEPFVQKVLTTKKPPVRRIGTRWRYAAAAAAILVFVVCSLWFVVGRRGSGKQAIVQTPAVQDVAPGRNGAVLTLADGSSIVLDSMANGILAKQNGSEVLLEDGKLSYDAVHSPLTTPTTSGQVDHSRPAYNVLTTPKGRQFQLVLPDGSKVWLNAASSITYPTAFTSNERQVKISGEVYFEVSSLPASPGGGGVKGNSPASRDKVPFIVDVDGKQTVEVLGTHFNINSYSDEDAIRTTLLEGKVKVVNRESSIVDNESVILQPGEQAAITTNHKLQTTNQINMDQIMAWKNGLFNFKNADIRTVMLQLARWYDIEVKYEGEIPTGTFRGKMPRDLPLSEALAVLQDVGVKFRIEGKTLVVTK